MTEWIARILPLEVPRLGRVDEPLRELARFRVRIVPPHQRPSRAVSGSRTLATDVGAVRLLVLDSANPNGGVGGSLDSDQAAWLVRNLQTARDRHVVVAMHDSSQTLTSPIAAAGEPPRVMGPEVVSLLLAHDNVVAWISNTLFQRHGRKHGPSGLGFWELPAASDGRDAALAGGMSVAVRQESRTVLLRGALGMEQSPSWEVGDHLAEAAFRKGLVGV